MQVVITDSCGLPRSFPTEEATSYSDTFPCKISKKLRFDQFYQQSLGGTTTPSNLNRFISYFSHCQPEIIIVQQGIIDCTPRSLDLVEGEILKRLNFKLYNYISQNERLIRFRNTRFVPKEKFKQALKKFRIMFDDSKIFWILPVYNFKSSSELLKKNCIEYSQIIKNIFGNCSIDLNKDFNQKNGFMPDGIHFSKKGHDIITSAIVSNFS